MVSAALDMVSSLEQMNRCPGPWRVIILKITVFNCKLMNIIRNRVSSHIRKSSSIHHPFFFFPILWQFFCCHNMVWRNLYLFVCLWHAIHHMLIPCIMLIEAGKKEVTVTIILIHAGMQYLWSFLGFLRWGICMDTLLKWKTICCTFQYPPLQNRHNGWLTLDFWSKYIKYLGMLIWYIYRVVFRPKYALSGSQSTGPRLQDSLLTYGPGRQSGPERDYEALRYLVRSLANPYMGITAETPWILD